MSQTKLSPPDAAMRRFLIVQFGVLGASPIVVQGYENFAGESFGAKIMVRG